MLSLESRELRKQARVLKSRRTEIVAGELGFRTDAKDFIHFGAGLATYCNTSESFASSQSPGHEYGLLIQ
jgi:hypothetical protein